jgi:hypothetical protein
MENFTGGNNEGGEGKGPEVEIKNQEQLNLTPEEQKELSLLVDEISKKTEFIKNINFEKLEPSNLAKLIEKAKKAKGILIGFGVMVTGGALIADAVINRNLEPYNAYNFNAGSWELIVGSLVALGGFAKATQGIELPKSGFNG